MFATMTAAFNKNELSSFLEKTLSGSASYGDLPKDGIKIKKKSKWDGKDAEPIVEEYYDDLWWVWINLYLSLANLLFRDILQIIW